MGCVACGHRTSRHAADCRAGRRERRAQAMAAASRRRRTGPLASRVGRDCLRRDKDERSLVDEARQALKRPSLDASGSTSVEELGALLSECRLLLTNDTGTMHVAAAVGTRVIDLSTGPVYVHETGPYGTGHLAVEPTIACFPVRPDRSAAICRAATISHPTRLRPSSATRWDTGRCHALKERECSRRAPQQSGRLEYVPLWLPSTTAADRVRHAAARVWEQTLDERWARSVPETDLSIRRDLDPALATIVDALQRCPLRRNTGGVSRPVWAPHLPDSRRAAPRAFRNAWRKSAASGSECQSARRLRPFSAIAVQSITEPSLDVIAVRYRTELVTLRSGRGCWLGSC